MLIQENFNEEMAYKVVGIVELPLEIKIPLTVTIICTFLKC